MKECFEDAVCRRKSWVDVLGTLLASQWTRQKQGLLSACHVLPPIPDFPRGCGKGWGAGHGRLQGAKGQGGDPDGQEAALGHARNC